MSVRLLSAAALAATLVGQGAGSAWAAAAPASLSHAARPRPVTSSVASVSPPRAADGAMPPLFGLRWLRPAGQPTLVVRVVDATGPGWPVRAAARLWTTRHVRLVVAPSCTGPGPCVVVREGRFGRTGWTGRTRAERGLMSTFASPVAIDLNDSYDASPRVRQAIACHELGHAVGLGHDPRATSCLQPSAVYPRPAAIDLITLERLYAQPD